MNYFSFADFDLSFHELECPFPCLEKVDLTYNLFSEDQALLPLATWPSLVEVDIWKNPLVKNRIGISSFLHYHLTVLCGIKINRLCIKTFPFPFSFVCSCSIS